MVFLGTAAALLIALIVGGLAVRYGARSGFVDRPDGDLKPHEGSPVPLGGLGLLVGVHVGLALAGAFDLSLLLATSLVWLVGLIDDARGLSPTSRLLGMMAGSLVLIGFSERNFEPEVAVFWFVAIVVVINAVNLFDGLDALAGTVSIVAILGLAIFGSAQGVPGPWVPMVIAGALLGFLYWNRPQARLYLGDNGAYVLGVLLAWAALSAGEDRMGGVVAVALVGVPLIDLAITVFRRGLSGAPLFSGDRDHTYDRLHDNGLPEKTVALSLSVLQALWIALVIAVAVLFGDLPAAITALAVGVGLAGAAGIWMTVSQQ